MFNAKRQNVFGERAFDFIGILRNMRAIFADLFAPASLYFNLSILKKNVQKRDYIPEQYTVESAIKVDR
jgi:hypothetical protein